MTFGLACLFFAQPGGASDALSEFDSRLAELSDILGSSMRSANHAAPNGSCAQPEEDGSANCKNQTSPNLLILPEIEMERLLNTQKWDTKYLLPIFNKK